MIDILCNFFFLNLESGEEKNEKLIYWFARYLFNEYLQLIGILQIFNVYEIIYNIGVACRERWKGLERALMVEFSHSST